MTTSDKRPPLDFKAMAAHHSRRDHGAVPVHVTFCGDEDPCESPLDDKRIDCRITLSVAADLAYYVRMMSDPHPGAAGGGWRLAPSSGDRVIDLRCRPASGKPGEAHRHHREGGDKHE